LTTITTKENIFKGHLFNLKYLERYNSVLMLDLQQLSHLELRQLCYFLTVVSHGNSISKAADALQIEQPPLSQRIKALEKRLNLKLFDRRYRPMQLTAAGEVFWRETQSALIQLQQAINQAQRAAKGEIGHLRIGIASSLINGILPDVLRRFRIRYPQVELELRELTAEQQLQALRERRLDIGLEAFPRLAELDNALSQKIVAYESLVIVLPDSHPLVDQTSIPLSAIAQEQLILPSLSAFPFYYTFIEACGQAGFQPQLVQSTTATWMLTILGMVVAGMGLAVLPSTVQAIQRDGVVYREIEGLDLRRKISAVWHQHHDSIILKHFLATFSQETP
jgi:DNA-binding transcriptional LysR family regulator